MEGDLGLISVKDSQTGERFRQETGVGSDLGARGQALPLPSSRWEHGWPTPKSGRGRTGGMLPGLAEERSDRSAPSPRGAGS